MDAAARETNAPERTAKSCGPDPPMLGSSLAWRTQGDGGQKPGAPRRPRISR